MPETIVVYAGFIKSDNVKAVNALKCMKDVNVVTVASSKGLDGMVKLPFIETPDGNRHYGVRSIENFAKSKCRQG